jgi:hypothetical protein
MAYKAYLAAGATQATLHSRHVGGNSSYKPRIQKVIRK